MDETEPSGNSLDGNPNRKPDESGPGQHAVPMAEPIKPQIPVPAVAPIAPSGLTGKAEQPCIHAGQRKEDLSPKPTDKPDPSGKQMVILTGIIALATIANVLIFYLESEDSGKQATKLTAKAGEIVTSMNTALSDNQTALSKAFKANQDSLDANNRQSKVALTASIGALQMDQRPWITVLRFELSNEPPEPTKGASLATAPFSMSAWIINNGKTPAIDVSTQSVGVLSDVPPVMTVFPVPTTGSRAIVPPTAGDRQLNTGPLLFPALNVSAYRMGASNLYLHAMVRYVDTFGRPHWTSICAYHVFGKPLNEFTFCVSGNDMDRDSQRQNPN